MTNGGGGEGSGRILTPSCLLPDGKYEVKYCYYETQNCFGAPKVVVHFAVVNHDSYAGSPLARYYNVADLKGPPRKYGNFLVNTENGHIVREYRRVCKDAPRNDRISFARFINKRILAKVRTVEKDSQRQWLHDDEQYSVISELVGVVPDLAV